MYHNICPVFYRAYQIRRCKGIIHNKRDLVFMGNFRNCFNIYHIRIGISQSFNKHSFCIILNGCFQLSVIKNIYKGGCDPILGKCVEKQVKGSSVNIFCRNNMTTVLRHILNGIGNSCCPGSYCKSCRSSLQGCHPFLKNILSGIGQPSVNISRIT